MNALSREDWQAYSEAFAFMGSTLLAPLSQTRGTQLEPEFWRAFPNFGSMAVEEALESMAACVAGIVEHPEIDPVTDVSVEYTRLFVGPPRPAAAPWETMHRGGGTNVGFGQATHEMRELMRAAGVTLARVNKQYEDHMGLELLYLSVVCANHASGGDEPPFDEDSIIGFVRDHPMAWIDKLAASVAAAARGGFFAHLLAIEKALLERFVDETASQG